MGTAQPSESLAGRGVHGTRGKASRRRSRKKNVSESSAVSESSGQTDGQPVDQPDSVGQEKKPGRPSRASQDPSGRFNCSRCGAEGRVRKTSWSLWHMQCPNCEAGKWTVFIPADQRKEMQRRRRH